jgi:putative endonuclease
VTDAWFAYILRCADDSLYAGTAKDVTARLATHNAGRGARYTRGRGPMVLVYSEACGSRGDALKREAAIKRLTRADKDALIAGASAAIHR